MVKSWLSLDIATISGHLCFVAQFSANDGLGSVNGEYCCDTAMHTEIASLVLHKMSCDRKSRQYILETSADTQNHASWLPLTGARNRLFTLQNDGHARPVPNPVHPVPRWPALARVADLAARPKGVASMWPATFPPAFR